MLLIYLLNILCKEYLFENHKPTGLSGTVDPLDDPFAVPGRNGLVPEEDLVALRAATGGYGIKPGYRNNK